MKKLLPLLLFLGQVVFVFCQPVFIGDTPATQDCAGTLFDSGGPNGEYSNSENLTFTVCPQDTHHCIFINVVELNTEENFDFLTIFAGPNIASPQVASLTGAGNNLEVQIHSSCVTFQFTSDFSTTESGFELTWQCSPDTCTIPPPVTCANPVVINSLPFLIAGLTTCSAGDEISNSPCNDDGYLGSEDYVFVYTSPGDECISVSITGSNMATGFGIYNGCLNTATQCIGQSGGGSGQSNPAINSVYLDAPGDYYIVVDNANSCTPFNISVEQATCPVIFPSAALCENALSLNGCGDLPAVISVAPGQGMNGFIQNGVNNGCWLTIFPLNFTWFFFEAEADGVFGFVMQAANPNEASDIDFQVWGPMNSPAAGCDFAKNNQPLRSSFAEGAEPTGMVNVHPTLGTPVTDVCEGPGGDDFVKPLEVEAGKFYFVLINDWGNQIVSGAISIDFAATTPGVLNAQPVNFSVSQDTAICKSEPVQLSASGGEIYNWFPIEGLSCDNCPNPVATIDESTIYSVAVNSICAADTLQVQVEVSEIPNIQIITDTMICLGDSIVLGTTQPEPGVTYSWSPPTGLDNHETANPVAAPQQSTQYTLSATRNGCTKKDSVNVLVVIPVNPVLVTPSQPEICESEDVQLDATAQFLLNFEWEPATGLSCADCANPVATPLVTTTYQVAAEYSGCPVSGSVTVKVVSKPGIVFPENFICPADTISLNLAPNGAWVYSWTSSDPGFSSAAASPEVSPASTTTYFVTVDNGICPPVSDSIIIFLIEKPILEISNDTIICGDNLITLLADAGSIPGTYTWQPGNASGKSFTPVLQEGINTFTVSFTDSNGCHTLSEIMEVELLPGIEILEINSDETDTVFQGTPVTLAAVTSVPASIYQWSSGSTKDTAMINPHLQPTETYSITVTDELGCTDSASIIITVLETKWNIPNVFTPNDDQWNQNFKVIISGKNIEVLSLKIWNRWGQLVFQELNGNNGWDGSYKNEGSPSDVYVYQVILRLPDGTELKKSGDMILLR